ncbi:hypothetical protein C7B76_04925 [filamentous cyanobacterium CCP2]|nr:hypothetical protein C7B76_04925 [filamentous cyanobacterium CCP2]
MARKIRSRIHFSGTLEAESPVHVGGMNDDPRVDLTLAVNGQGNYYIPGTSLAGALRAWMARQDEDITDHLWGALKERGDGGHASFILIEDAPVQGKVNTEIRDGVGIDRFTGSAAEHMKFDRAILPKGTQIRFRLILEGDASLTHEQWEERRLLCNDLIQAMQSGHLRLGAAKTRGLGQIRLKEVSFKEQQLLTREGMLALLQYGGVERQLEHSSNPLSQTLMVEITWKPLSPLMVKAEQDGIAVDILPLVSSIGDFLTFVLPGASIKGALRTQAERIVRTLLSQEIPKQADSRQQFLRQLEVPLVEELFGAAAKVNAKTKTKGGQIGALAVDDCYADLKINAEDWDSVTAATSEAELRQALDQSNLQQTQQAFHVAIDRWTGGAADGFLYSTLEPMGITWQPIQLTLDLHRLKDSQPVAIALLLFILRDLANNRIPLGYGTNRGMGAIEVEQITFEGEGLDDSLGELTEKSLVKDDGMPFTLTQLESEVLATLNHAWRDRITSLKQEIMQ